MRFHKIWWHSNLFQFDPAFLLLSRNMPQRNLLARSALIPLGGCTVPLIHAVLQKYKFFVADFRTPNDSSMTRFLIHINIRQPHMNWGIWHSSRWWVTYFLCTSFDQYFADFACTNNAVLGFWRTTPSQLVGLLKLQPRANYSGMNLWQILMCFQLVSCGERWKTRMHQYVYGLECINIYMPCISRPQQ